MSQILRSIVTVTLICVSSTFCHTSTADDVAAISAERVIRLPAAADRSSPPVVSCVSLHPHGKLIAMACDDHMVRVWDIQRSQFVQALTQHHDWVRALAYSPDGKSLATAGNDRQIILWNAETGQKLRVLAEHDQAITNIVYTHDGAKLAAIGFEKGMHIYDARSGERLYSFNCPCIDMRAIAFSADDRLLAAGGRNGKIRIWSTDEDSQARDLLAHDQRIRSLAFSPDGKLLVSVADDGQIRVTPVDQQHDGFVLDSRPAKVSAVKFIGANHIVTAGSDNLIRLWDITARREIDSRSGHTGTVTTLDNSGDVIVSGSYDTTVRIWKIDRNAAADGGSPRGRIDSARLPTIFD